MSVESGRLRVVAPTERPEEPANQASDLNGAPSPGRYIRDQRQRRGLSLDQMAAATKIPRSSLTLLEEDRYGELPGPVFAKGFLRCCARALEVDPDVVMELLYERERAALVARRREQSAHRPAAADDKPIETSKPARPGPPDHGALQRVLAHLPTAQQLLWVVVAALVAMVLMAAFNLVGGVAGGPTS